MDIASSGYLDIKGEAVGRIGDYSPDSFILAAKQFAEKGSPSSVTLFVQVDETKKWESPSPHFTLSGGHSYNTFYVLLSIHKQYKNSSDVTSLSDSKGCTFLISRNSSGDLLVGTKTKEGVSGAVVRFLEKDIFFTESLALLNAIKQDGNSERVVGFDVKTHSRNPYRLGLAMDSVPSLFI